MQVLHEQANNPQILSEGPCKAHHALQLLMFSMRDKNSVDCQMSVFGIDTSSESSSLGVGSTRGSLSCCSAHSCFMRIAEFDQSMISSPSAAKPAAS